MNRILEMKLRMWTESHLSVGMTYIGKPSEIMLHIWTKGYLSVGMTYIEKPSEISNHKLADKECCD